MGKVKLAKRLTPELEILWQRLWGRSSFSHFFNSPWWFKACLDAFGIDDLYLFIYLTKNESLEGILPLVNKRKYGINVLASPGKKYLDKSALLLSNKKGVAQELIMEAKRNGNIYLSEVNPHILTELSGLNMVHSMASINPYIILHKNSFGHLSSKQRNSIQNKIQKYKSKLTFHFNLEPTRDLLETIFEIERRSNKKKLKRDIFSDTEARRLFQNIASFAPKNCSINILYYNEEPIAHVFGLVYRDTFMAYHMAYLENFKKIMPGKMLIYYILDSCKKTDCKIFDFSRGDSALKRQFTKNRLLHYDVFILKNFLIQWYLCYVLLIKNMKVRLTRLIRCLFLTKSM